MKSETMMLFVLVAATHLNLFGNFFVDLFIRNLGWQIKPHHKIHGSQRVDVVL